MGENIENPQRYKGREVNYVVPSIEDRTRAAGAATGTGNAPSHTSAAAEAMAGGTAVSPRGLVRC